MYDNQGYRNTSNMTLTGSYNASHTRYFCVNSSTGKLYKIAMWGETAPSGNNTNWSVEYIQDLGESSGSGGSSGISSDENSQSKYYNATLKSIRVSKFDFSSGETVLQEKVDFNVTSKHGTVKANRKVVNSGGRNVKIESACRHG